MLPGEFVIEHLPGAGGPVDDSWLAVVRAPEGLTVIRELTTGAQAPAEVWVALYGDSAHGLDLPGMLAAVVGPLGDAAVPVFVASTFHADLVLVPREHIERAFEALRAAGHRVAGTDQRGERAG